MRPITSRIELSATRLVPQVRAAHGLVAALVAVYAPQLEETEEEVRRLGNTSSDGNQYEKACYRAEELRGLVAIAKAAAKELRAAKFDVGRLVALTKGGAQ